MGDFHRHLPYHTVINFPTLQKNKAKNRQNKKDTDVENPCHRRERSRWSSSGCFLSQKASETIAPSLPTREAATRAGSGSSIAAIIATIQSGKLVFMMSGRTSGAMSTAKGAKHEARNQSLMRCALA